MVKLKKGRLEVPILTLCFCALPMSVFAFEKVKSLRFLGAKMSLCVFVSVEKAFVFCKKRLCDNGFAQTVFVCLYKRLWPLSLCAKKEFVLRKKIVQEGFFFHSWSNNLPASTTSFFLKCRPLFRCCFSKEGLQRLPEHKLVDTWEAHAFPSRPSRARLRARSCFSPISMAKEFQSLVRLFDAFGCLRLWEHQEFNPEVFIFVLHTS